MVIHLYHFFLVHILYLKNIFFWYLKALSTIEFIFRNFFFKDYNLIPGRNKMTELSVFSFIFNEEFFWQTFIVPKNFQVADFFHKLLSINYILRKFIEIEERKEIWDKKSDIIKNRFIGKSIIPKKFFIFMNNIKYLLLLRVCYEFFFNYSFKLY